MAIAQKRATTAATTISATTGGTFNLPNNPGTTALAFNGNTATKNQNVYAATGPFAIKLGTGHDNYVYFTGGDQKATSVTGLGGNDNVILRGGAHGTYTVNLGTGQNTLSLGNAWGSVAYTTTNAAATTYDTLDLSNVTTNFTALSLTATTGAVATTSGTIANATSFRNLKLGSGTATVTLNNLDDTLTFGNGQSTVTGGTGDDIYAFKNFTGASNVTHSITDAAGVNTIDLSATTTNVAVNFTSATGGSVVVSGTGTGAGKTATANFSGATGIANVIGGSGNDTFSFGNTAGSHSVNGGLGNNTLVYNGSQGVTLDLRDHELANASASTDITFHSINTFKVLGAGSNTVIGDGTAGNTYYFGNGTNYIDTTGGTTTIHNDMGGNTTAVLGSGYGAMTVTNTAAAGRLTIDVSSMTQALTGTVALGAGGAGPQITNGAGDTVTWAATSKVTGFVGNNQATVVTGAGNLNYQITTGSGADSITASGTGNNAINTGSGNDTVSVGDGDNTIIFGAGTDSLTAGNGANSVFFGGGSTAATLGTGGNVLDFSNGGTHTVTMGTGDSVLQGFDGGHTWTVDLTSGMGGTKGTLDLSNFASTDVVWSNSASPTDITLTIGGSSILIQDYFDGSQTSAATGVAGTGGIQKIIFSDDSNFDITDVQHIAVAGGWH
jgi:hypothetical protein